MKSNFAGIWVFLLLLGSVAPLSSTGLAQPTTGPVAQDQDPLATRELVREIQFMLLRLGLDPGPLDGLPLQLTNGAVRRFEQMNGLPLVELQPGGKVPAAFLARLRAEAGRAMLGGAGKLETEPRSSSPPAGEAPVPVAAPALPKAPPPKRRLRWFDRACHRQSQRPSRGGPPNRRQDRHLGPQGGAAAGPGIAVSRMPPEARTGFSEQGLKQAVADAAAAGNCTGSP